MTRSRSRQGTSGICAKLPLTRWARQRADYTDKGIDTGTLAGFGPAAMMANDNDLIRSSPIPA